MRDDLVMAPSFAGAKLKIKRTYQHINELELWLRDLQRFDSDVARAYKKAGGDPNGSVLVQRDDRFTNPAPIVGDAVHNLRSALDHSAFAIVEAAGGNTDKLFFPM